MSRVGSSAITIPADVTMSHEGGVVVVKGKNGELSAPLHSDVELKVADNLATLSPRRNTREAKALWGTMRASVSNMVVGVSEGFTRKLEINGVGYRAAMQGNKLVLNLGYSHPVEMDVPQGLSVNVENNTSVTITGADKQLLGQFAAEVRAKRPPEPFKGKGVKYADEYIVRKEGKKK
ncbi:MAG: 50S ribosomal protein L6 [Alphaproteobacteria bacterium]|jgi:large subunit ribosomal protein L6|nr:50S ribosomal protein L6 [Alphaproteobacteria bacterium]PDH62850.1 MAG: 50S ribosomal protein L6 [SAR116 cluster bacterium MED-G05]MBL6672499.1 50S ribosomal protein L6 [Alphaproteobacteria bacterium]HBD53074.1 50S ribosomal protein L6 [Alphaproteobacteria bacterium]HBP73957.1 50S ribosomal protein L6 [Alphaproteobacteria bacterium]|tara:strand:+ start:2993 stop:3526 length:534 start_codon:yes stop_codon:yes gene_type:complete